MSKGPEVRRSMANMNNRKKAWVVRVQSMCGVRQGYSVEKELGEWSGGGQQCAWAICCF